MFSIPGLWVTWSVQLSCAQSPSTKFVGVVPKIALYFLHYLHFWVQETGSSSLLVLHHANYLDVTQEALRLMLVWFQMP